MYVICPGSVYSKNDGQLYFVSSTELAKLYGLSLTDPNVRILHEGDSIRKNSSDIYLRPKSTGDYRLPEPEPND